MEEKYFVGSNGDEPERIYFTGREAFFSGDDYIDSFDEGGNRVCSYKFVDDEYTTDF